MFWFIIISSQNIQSLHILNNICSGLAQMIIYKVQMTVAVDLRCICNAQKGADGAIGCGI